MRKCLLQVGVRCFIRHYLTESDVHWRVIPFLMVVLLCAVSCGKAPMPCDVEIIERAEVPPGKAA